jgi:high affinity Mn2+ porin
LWKGAEVHFNPEIAGGSGLSGARGMAGSSNGETFRVGDPSPTFYTGRLYLKQTFPLNRKGENNVEAIEHDENQLAGYQPKRFVEVLIGKTSMADLMDNNAYANSARDQFMNWALMNNGAWDFAANTRGYTYLLSTKVQLDKMFYTATAAMLPHDVNGPDMNSDITEALSGTVEAGRRISINKRPGTVRLLAYLNTANMGSYQDAIALSNLTGQAPDLRAVEKFGNIKYGFGLNMEQELSDMLGIFLRAGWNDGKTENWCFSEIDQTLTVGLSANGSRWKRPDDNLGLAVAVNGISEDHRQYLALGGKGFMIGDGALNYARETIAELYYNFRPLKKGIWFTGDYQFCLNPGYNADRGPVNIFSIRVHAEL